MTKNIIRAGRQVFGTPFVIEENKRSHKGDPIKMRSRPLENIAIPYYGNIARPGHGLEKVYFIVQACRFTGQIDNIQIMVWTGRNVAELIEWFKNKNVTAVVSGERSTKIEFALENSDIMSCWNAYGEVKDMVQCYLGARAAA